MIDYHTDMELQHDTVPHLFENMMYMSRVGGIVYTVKL